MPRVNWAVFETFPQIKQLGRAKLQSLCDEWLKTPVARENAVTMIAVDDSAGIMDLSFSFEWTHDFGPGEEYYFPTDELLFFIAEHGIDATEREGVRNRITNARRKGGPYVYRRIRFNPSGPKLPLFIDCKLCGNVMITNLEAYQGPRTEFAPEEMTCPRCGQTFMTVGNEFHFGPNEKRPKA